MSRGLRIRIAVHATVLLVWTLLSIYCLTPYGSQLANSVPFVAFDRNFAIAYTAVSSLEALWSGRKADPDDPA